MRLGATLVVAVLVVVAGCAAPSTSSADQSPATPAQTTAQQTPAETTGVENSTSERSADSAPPDPDSDRIGWEGGYWYNESIDVTNVDGLTDEEYETVLHRTQARIEYIRGKEFTEDVTVREFDPDQSPGVVRPDEGEDLLTFEDVRYEALFLVGEETNGRELFWAGFGDRGAFYDYWNHSAVLKISDRDKPVVFPQQFSHELAHALQDQRYNLTEFIGRPTMDGSYARRSVVEGSAKIVDRVYVQFCENGTWDCLQIPPGASPALGETPHVGQYGLQLVWYEHGMAAMYPTFEADGFDGVEQYWETPPSSTEQVVAPSSYPDDDPVNVTLADATSDGWERVRPGRGFPYQQRPAYARNGQAGVASMFIQASIGTLVNATYDGYNESAVIDINETVNRGFGGNPETPHASYDFPYADGWAGDRLHVYQRGNATGYVWRIVWESPADASEFHDGYREVLAHWGAEQVGNGTWHIDDSESRYDGNAFRVTVDGDTVTIVNAPAVDELDDVRAPDA